MPTPLFKRLTRPLATHSLVLLLAACGSVATLSGDQCSAAVDGLDDSDLFESQSISAQALPPVPVPTLEKTAIVDLLAARTGLSKKQAGEAVAVTFDIIVEALKDNKKVNLVGLGSLTPKIRPARVYTNPKTGAPVPRPAITYIAWKATNTLKGNLSPVPWPVSVPVTPSVPTPAPSPAPAPTPDPTAPVAQ